MARYMDEKDTAIYRVVSTILNKHDNTTSTRLRGPYTTVGAAKGQAGNGWYNHDVIDAKVQQLGIEIDDNPDDIVARLAWVDVVVYDGSTWNSVS